MAVEHRVEWPLGMHGRVTADSELVSAELQVVEKVLRDLQSARKVGVRIAVGE